MSLYKLIGLVFLLPFCQLAATADDPVFSGPQVGETLPPFNATGVFGDLAGKEFDLIERADGKPVVLIFVHALTRPGFGLTNTIMRYAASRSKDGIERGVVFLTDDATKTANWMGIVKKNFPDDVTFGYSPDGIEGPGSYGLNRNVTLTILVGKQGKVTANFALVQPSLQADGPGIVKAIVDVTGGGKVPTMAELGGGQYARATGRNMRTMEKDPELEQLLRAVINKQASDDGVAQAAAAVEKHVAENENGRQEIGRIATTIVDSGKLSNYGTEAAQKILQEWAKKYGNPAKQRGDSAAEKKNDAAR